MSSWPGFALEDFICDAMQVTVDGAAPGMRSMYAGQNMLTQIQFSILVALFEPAREYIEEKLLDYDEEDHGSWRDYKYMTIFEGIPSPVLEAAHKYLDNLDAPKTELFGAPPASEPVMRKMTGADLGLPNDKHYALWMHATRLATLIAQAVDEGHMEQIFVSGLLRAFAVARHYEDIVHRHPPQPSNPKE